MFKILKISCFALFLSMSSLCLAETETNPADDGHCHTLVDSLRLELSELQVSGPVSLWLQNTQQLFNAHAEQEQRHKLNSIIDQLTDLQQKNACSDTHKIALDNVLNDALDLDTRVSDSKRSYLTNNLLVLGTAFVGASIAIIFKKINSMQRMQDRLAAAIEPQDPSTPDGLIARGRPRTPAAPVAPRSSRLSSVGPRGAGAGAGAGAGEVSDDSLSSASLATTRSARTHVSERTQASTTRGSARTRSVRRTGNTAALAEPLARVLQLDPQLNGAAATTTPVE